MTRLNMMVGIVCMQHMANIDIADPKYQFIGVFNENKFEIKYSFYTFVFVLCRTKGISFHIYVYCDWVR